MSSKTAKDLREWVKNIRRKPTPLADAIPMVLKAADLIDLLTAANDQAHIRETQLREVLAKYARPKMVVPHQLARNALRDIQAPGGEP